DTFINMDKSWMETNRINKSYVDGVAAFTDYAHKVEEVQYHLYRHGIDISYTKWTKHGEEDEPSISAPKPVNATTEFVDDIDFAYIPIDGTAKSRMVESISEDLRWHATQRITDGVLHHPVDSQAWGTIDEKFPEIAEDTRNLRLGISADGVDVNTGNRHHSVWPVLTVIYNLPPWLCMKRKFINLSARY
ncbi:glutamate receptor 2.8-like protein, partial [Tanacetum coccineum]